jgi:hypothetical protein
MATKASHKLDIFIYEFVERAIIEKGQEVLTGKKEVSRPEDMIDIIKDIADRIKNIENAKPMGWRKWFRGGN